MRTDRAYQSAVPQRVHRWTRNVAIVAALGIVTGELLRCASIFSIPGGLAATVAGVLVVFALPFFVGMAIRQWAVAIIGGLTSLYGLVWLCHRLSEIPMYADPPMGLVLMVIYPVGWSAMTLGWLGSRVPWVLERLLTRVG